MERKTQGIAVHDELRATKIRAKQLEDELSGLKQTSGMPKEPCITHERALC